MTIKAVLAAAVVALVTSAASASAQALGDIAKKEEARRKTVKTREAVHQRESARRGRAAAGTSDRRVAHPGDTSSGRIRRAATGRGRCQEGPGVLEGSTDPGANGARSGHDVCRGAAKPHQRPDHRFRRTRRSGTAREDRVGSREGARGTRSSQEGNPGQHESDCRYPGRGTQGRRSRRLAAVARTDHPTGPRRCRNCCGTRLFSCFPEDSTTLHAAAGLRQQPACVSIPFALSAAFR